MKVFKNISNLVTLRKAHEKDGRNLLMNDLSIIEEGAIAFNENEILWVGKTSELPAEYKDVSFESLKGKTLMPELVDSHTHTVFGGNRAKEYTMRLNGAGYEEIAQAGGGILNTMSGTNALSRAELFELSKKRIEKMHGLGVGTIEIKSGYGLNYEKEKEISLVIDDLKKHFAPKVQIKNTYMAAHAVPKDYRSSETYMTEMVLPLLRELSELNILDAVDIFYERGYFDREDTQKLIKVAKELNIPFKFHADEFYDNKGALLAAKSGALSCDHLLCTDIDGIEALAESDTVATLLPGTGLFLGKPQANARAFLDRGVKVSIGSDYNPGSCHFDNLLLIASIAAPQYKMNSAELYCAITLNAAHALGMKDQGALIEGLKPRFSIFNCSSLDEIAYNWGNNLSY